MTTDPSPRRLVLRHEYEASTSLQTLPGPRPDDLASLFGLLATARDAENRALVEKACRLLLERLSDAYETSRPTLRLLGPRPHPTREGRLSYELFGDYDL